MSIAKIKKMWNLKHASKVKSKIVFYCKGIRVVTLCMVSENSYKALGPKFFIYLFAFNGNQ